MAKENMTKPDWSLLPTRDAAQYDLIYELLRQKDFMSKHLGIRIDSLDTDFVTQAQSPYEGPTVQERKDAYDITQLFGNFNGVLLNNRFIVEVLNRDVGYDVQAHAFLPKTAVWLYQYQHNLWKYHTRNRLPSRVGWQEVIASLERQFLVAFYKSREPNFSEKHPFGAYTSDHPEILFDIRDAAIEAQKLDAATITDPKRLVEISFQHMTNFMLDITRMEE